tara:strand:+ start:10076 stop:10774 length:699 start_codon:yes stop_codon:yes gene_type:complete
MTIDIDNIKDNAFRSASDIANYDLKNRRKHKFVPTKIIDNFFESPSLWRNLALTQQYQTAETTTYPGKRSDYLNEIDPMSFELLARNLLKHLPQFRGFNNLWATFHLIDGSYGSGWVHDDDPSLSVSGLIYLNPNPPAGSGTVLYNDRFDDQATIYSDKFREDVLLADTEGRKKLDKYREEHRAFFTPNTTVENVYNRCVLFDPKVWHSPGEFFGSTNEDSRLTLVFFANGG